MVLCREAYTAQIRMLEREVEEKQRQYESLRKLKTSDPSNSFHDQANQVQLIREIVEHVQRLATQRISDSDSVMRTIAPEEASSAHTSTGRRSSTRSTPSYDPFNHLHRPYPSPPPRPQEQDNDKPLSRTIFRPVEQNENTLPAGSSRLPREHATVIQSSANEVAAVEPSDPISPSSNSSTKNQSLNPPVTVEGNDSSQELQEEPNSLIVQVLQPPPTRPRYRMVVRRGKMVPREWRRPEDDDASAASSSSSL